MTGTGRRHTSSQLDIPTLLVSLAAGLIGCLISSFVYMLIKESLWSPLAVGFSFMIFSVIFILIMVVFSIVNENLGYHVARQHDGGQICIALVLIILLSLVLGIFFEFLYEIDMYSEQDIYQSPTSYVFIIDNSGSMEENDPEGLRYSAIRQIMGEKDESFPYAVYSFSNTVVTERSLAPISAGNHEFQPMANGGTALRLALKTVFSEYKNGLKNQMGDAPKVLLLSDGYAGDIGWFSKIDKLLKSYAKENITISTVGLGQPDEALMKQIADTTGGVYVSVDDVDMLEESMEQAIKESSDDKYVRTLYTHRTVPRADFVYGIMRVLFMGVLGIMISCAMLFATGKGEDQTLIIMSSLITGILGGLLMEFGINLLGIAPVLIKTLYFMLVASTFITVKAFGGRGDGHKYRDEEQIVTQYRKLDKGVVSGIDNRPGQGGSRYKDLDDLS